MCQVDIKIGRTIDIEENEEFKVNGINKIFKKKRRNFPNYRKANLYGSMLQLWNLKIS